MFGLTAKSDISEHNRELAQDLVRRVENHRLDFAHSWADDARRKLERALHKQAEQFFKDMTHASRGVGRTSPLSRLPGGISSMTAGLPWKPLSESWKKRKVPGNKERFFHNTGKLKKQLRSMSWGQLFGTPDVTAHYETQPYRVEVLKEGVVREQGATGSRYRGAKGRFVKVTEALKTEMHQREYVELEVNYASLLEAYDGYDHNVFEREVMDQDRSIAHKLGGPRGIVRPLVTPFAEWYVKDKLPRVLRGELKKVKAQHGFV